MTLSRRRALLLPILAGIALFAAACGGLSESAWRRELEPLLPEGATIVESWSENCTVEPNCAVGFVLEHDRERYAEDAVAFASTMESEGWTKVGEHNNVDSAGARFDRRGIRVTLNLLSPSWRERCVETRGGADDPTCKSTLVVKN